MKKILLVILSIILSVAFSSCTSKNTEENTNTKTDSSVVTEESNIDEKSNSTSQDSNTNNNKKPVTYKGKTVTNILLDLNGYRTEVGTENASKFLNLETLEEAEAVDGGMELGSLILIYDNDEEERFGYIFIGKDKNLYLRTVGNSKIYKFADSSVMDELLYGYR